MQRSGPFRVRVIGFAESVAPGEYSRSLTSILRQLGLLSLSLSAVLPRDALLPKCDAIGIKAELSTGCFYGLAISAL
jgi:hypothetical protein